VLKNMLMMLKQFQGFISVLFHHVRRAYIKNLVGYNQKKLTAHLLFFFQWTIKTGGNTGKIDAHLRDTGNTRLSSFK